MKHELWIGQYQPDLQYGLASLVVDEGSEEIVASLLAHLDEGHASVVALEGRRLRIEAHKSSNQSRYEVLRRVFCEVAAHVADAGLIFKAFDDSWVDSWDIKGGELTITRKQAEGPNFVDLGAFLREQARAHEELESLASTDALHWVWNDLAIAHRRVA